MFSDVDFANIKPSILNFVILMALIAIGVPLMKATLGQLNIPGISSLINAI